MHAKILIVDDTPANLVAMRHLLAHCGAELHEARSGNEALALCLDHDYALILLDVNMPGMDGFEVARLLDGNERLREVPIIFVTAAHADERQRLKGYRAGAIDYLTKPVDDAILQSKVRLFLELHEAKARLQQAVQELARRNEELSLEVEERKLIEAMVRHQASHDPLTGLPNRMLFHDRLLGAIERAGRHGRGFALANIDLDGFKQVNDGHGHAAGDALLQEIAGRLLAQLRRTDTVARLGGDEFALIMEDLDVPAQALQLCEKLCATLAEPYALRVDGRSIAVRVSASIGIAWHDHADTRRDAESRLMLEADHAMYAAKRGGRNRCALAAAGAPSAPAG